MCVCVIFFFKQKTAYEMRISDWSSDVCSSDLIELPVRSILAEPSMPLHAIVALKPGDVIPISLPEELHLLVERTTFGVGTPGEANGNAAIQIKSIALPSAATNR